MKRFIIGVVMLVMAAGGATAVTAPQAVADPDPPPIFYQIPANTKAAWDDVFLNDTRLDAWYVESGEYTFIVSTTTDRDNLITQYGDQPWANWEIESGREQVAIQDDVHYDQPLWNPGLQTLEQPYDPDFNSDCTGGWGWNPAESEQWFGDTTSGADYAITAGHCLPMGQDPDTELLQQTDNLSHVHVVGQWNQPDDGRTSVDNNGDDSVKYDDKYWGDISLYFVPDNQVSTSAYRTLNTTKPITTPFDGAVDDYASGDICVFGAKTHDTRCGFTVNHDNDFGARTGNFTSYERMSELRMNTSDCSIPVEGDSGGLVFRKDRNGQGDWVGIRPMGIISTTDPNCLGDWHVTYTSIQIIDDLWPGTVIN